MTAARVLGVERDPGGETRLVPGRALSQNEQREEGLPVEQDRAAADRGDRRIGRRRRGHIESRVSGPHAVDGREPQPGQGRPPLGDRRPHRRPELGQAVRDTCRRIRRRPLDGGRERPGRDRPQRAGRRRGGSGHGGRRRRRRCRGRRRRRCSRGRRTRLRPGRRLLVRRLLGCRRRNLVARVAPKQERKQQAAEQKQAGAEQGQEYAGRLVTPSHSSSRRVRAGPCMPLREGFRGENDPESIQPANSSTNSPGYDRSDSAKASGLYARLPALRRFPSAPGHIGARRSIHETHRLFSCATKTSSVPTHDRSGTDICCLRRRPGRHGRGRSRLFGGTRELGARARGSLEHRPADDRRNAQGGVASGGEQRSVDRLADELLLPVAAL